jgi:perosamine synthetase
MIEQMAPWIGTEELMAMTAYLCSGGWLTEHDKTAEFEEMVAEYVGARYCIATTSGTTALVVALDALGIGQGDEVMVPALTQTASAGAVELVGAKPVLVDVDPATLCMDLMLAEQAISARTKAIMVVDLNGRSPNMLTAATLAGRFGLYLLEDAAQALGSKYSDRHLGTFGIAGCFSFSSPKVITTGQGGVIVTDDKGLADRARHGKNFGEGLGTREFGVNFKFTDLQAVIGIEQMKKLPWRVARKKGMFALYRLLLSYVDQVKFIPTNLDQTTPWFIDIIVPDAIKLQQYLAEREIDSRLFYTALRSGYPNAVQNGLWLPSSSFLTDENIRHVCDEIREFYK